jgi:type II secretory pathway pseudopilin PulG
MNGRLLNPGQRAAGLAEVLIALALVGILAALALPGYWNAQTRSRVSRVRADLRALDVAVEAYLLNNSHAPLFPSIRATGETRASILLPLTTPVAYIPAIPSDPFNGIDAWPANRVYAFQGFDYTWGSQPNCPYWMKIAEPTAARFYDGFPDYSDGSRLKRTRFWNFFSPGPDGIFSILDPAYPSPFVSYDPTNGTQSKGDILRLRYSPQ